jgi:hypothetical protein
MKTPQASVALKEQPIETVQGWVPVPFEESPMIAAGASYTMQEQHHIALKGPYLFRFSNPEGVRVQAIKVGNYALEGNDSGIDAATLIANTDTSQIGDQFFPIDGPMLEIGSRFTVTVVNTSGVPRKINLTIYALRVVR